MYGKCAECTAQNLEEFRHVFGPAALLSPNPGCVVEHGAALESLDEHDSADHEHASVTRAAQNCPRTPCGAGTASASHASDRV
jgi:ribosomal protein S27AE